MITAQSFIPLNERLREALRPGGNLRPSSETVFDGPGFVRREHWCPVQMGHEGAAEIWQNGRSLVAGQGAAEFEHLLRCAHYLKHHHEHHAAHPLRFGGFGLPSPLQCPGKGTQSCQDIKQNGFVVRGKLVHFLNLDAVGVELCGQAFTRMTPGLRFFRIKTPRLQQLSSSPSSILPLVAIGEHQNAISFHWIRCQVVERFWLDDLNIICYAGHALSALPRFHPQKQMQIAAV